MKTLIWLAVLMIVCLLLPAGIASCNNNLGNDQNLYIGAVQNNTANGLKASYAFFNGRETRVIPVEAGQTLEFSYKSTVEQGELTITVEDPAKNKVANLKSGVDASEEVNADQAGNYRLVITGKETKGSYDVKWETK